MVYNSDYQNSWRMLYPGHSFLEVKFNTSNVDSNIDLILVHLTSSMGSQPGYSPVDGVSQLWDFGGEVMSSIKRLCCIMKPIV